MAAELLRTLFQERSENEAEYVRSAAGAVVLLRELRRISAEQKATREAIVETLARIFR